MNEDRQPEVSPHDKLTGLMNLRSFMGTAQAFLRAGNARRVVVAMWDVDGLRALNSKHGHAVGDQAVRWVAHRLSMTLGAAGLVARYGGDEFAVLLPEVGRDEGMALLEAAWAAIRVPMDAPNLQISATWGAVSSTATHDCNRLLRIADAALYRAKRSKAGGHMSVDDGSG